jgi:PAB-dependent poly(A)-specific ribonuclease subunit 3
MRLSPSSSGLRSVSQMSSLCTKHLRPKLSGTTVSDLSVIASTCSPVISAVLFVYTYHPNSFTLHDAHIKNRQSTYGRQTSSQAAGLIPERTIWSYIIQIASAIKAAHDAGLAVRMIDVTKILLTGKNRVRVSACGIADVLTYNPTLTTTTGSGNTSNAPSPVIAVLQQDDLVMFGKLIFALCCGSNSAMENLNKSLETMGKHYSSDLKNVALFMLSNQQKHIGQVFDMLGSRLLTEIDDLQK